MMLRACYFPDPAADAFAAPLLKSVDGIELSAVDELVVGLAGVVGTDDVHVPPSPINELDPKPKVGARVPPVIWGPVVALSCEESVPVTLSPAPSE